MLSSQRNQRSGQLMAEERGKDRKDSLGPRYVHRGSWSYEVPRTAGFDAFSLLPPTSGETDTSDAAGTRESHRPFKPLKKQSGRKKQKGKGTKEESVNASSLELRQPMRPIQISDPGFGGTSSERDEQVAPPKRSRQKAQERREKNRRKGEAASGTGTGNESEEGEEEEDDEGAGLLTSDGTHGLKLASSLLLSGGGRRDEADAWHTHGCGACLQRLKGLLLNPMPILWSLSASVRVLRDLRDVRATTPRMCACLPNLSLSLSLPSLIPSLSPVTRYLSSACPITSSPPTACGTSPFVLTDGASP